MIENEVGPRKAEDITIDSCFLVIKTSELTSKLAKKANINVEWFQTI